MLRPAQYLLRFDDLCPRVSREKWERFLPLIERYGIKPILGVIPDNQDHRLNVSPPDANFWAEMRALQNAGATIALHGYQHLCYSTGKSMLGLHRKSEFAGINRDMQRNWIRDGLRILREQGLTPTVWIAPRHGFDELTLSVLRGEGIKVLSDGFARVPCVRQGVMWIPQQLWAPVVKQKGLWTICIHPNTVGDKLVTQLDEFLQGYGAQFTSVDRVLAEMRLQKLPWSELLYERVALWRAQRRHKQRRKRSR
jgi:predicted deacetylase